MALSPGDSIGSAREISPERSSDKTAAQNRTRRANLCRDCSTTASRIENRHRCRTIGALPLLRIDSPLDVNETHGFVRC
jgi:hypothetical protein